MDYHPNSPDLTLLFPHIENKLRGQRFNTPELIVLSLLSQAWLPLQ